MATSAKGAAPNRVSVYRRYKRLLGALDSLRDLGVIEAPAHIDCVSHLRVVYDGWRSDLLAAREPSPNPRGRPMAPDDRRRYKQCKRAGCANPPAPGQAYCQKDCSPWGHYGVAMDAEGYGDK